GVDGLAVDAGVLGDPPPEGVLLALAAPLVERLADVADGDDLAVEEAGDDAVALGGGLVGVVPGFRRGTERRGSVGDAVAPHPGGLGVADERGAAAVGRLDQGERLVLIVAGPGAEELFEFVGHAVGVGQSLRGGELSSPAARTGRAGFSGGVWAKETYCY